MPTHVKPKPEPSKCPHCARQLSIVNICRWCRNEVKGMKPETLVLIIGGILLAGFILGALVAK